MNRGHQTEATIGVAPPQGTLGWLIAIGAVFLIYILLGSPAYLRDHLALTPRLALGHEPWQLLTAGFFHMRFGALLSSAVTIFFFASPVEQSVGRGGLIKIMFGAVVVSSLATALVGLWLAPDLIVPSAMGASMAALSAFGVLYARMPLSLFGASQMRGSTLALIFIAIAFAMYAVDRDILGGSGALAAALFGWVAAARLGRTGASSGGASGTRGMFDRMRLWRLRRRYKVISGGRDTKRYLN